MIKVIICDPVDFENKYEEFLNQQKEKLRELNKEFNTGYYYYEKSISHDGNNHYINYEYNFSYFDD